MRRSIYILLSAALLLNSCKNSDIDEIQLYDTPQPANNRLTALLEGQSRTSIGGFSGTGYKNLWSENDQLAVYIDGGESPVKFVLAEGAGQTKASFEGYGRGSSYVAIYPYDAKQRLKDGSIAYTLPEKQQYAEGTFADGAFPMAAVGGDDGLFVFRNLCAVVKVPVKGSHIVRSIIFAANSTETKVAGAAVITTAGEPALTMESSAMNTLTLECKGGVQLDKDTATDFYIVVPAQTYAGGFTISIISDEGVGIGRFESDIVMARSQMRELKSVIDYDSIFIPAENSLTIVHSSNEFVIPSFSSYSTLSGTVSWGDGATGNVNSSKSHIYSTTGEHSVTIELKNSMNVHFDNISDITTIDFSKF